MQEVEYVTATSLETLKLLLNKNYLSKGYRVEGSVQFYSSYYVQTVTREIKPSKPHISLEPITLNKNS